MSARVIVCCGSGGVGKTTISAALALKLASEGERVAVLTIDPARRLADSLGVAALSNVAQRVPAQGLAAGGRLDAAMLDARATFDGLVHRFASSPQSAERILANRYYQYVSTRLGGSHEYMALERLLQLLQEDYDTVVLDTPPTRHALDFLTAPDRLTAVLDEGVLRWLALPTNRGGWRALELGSEVVAGVLRRLVGSGTVGEIAEFFDLFRDLSEQMSRRTREVAGLLADPATRFLLVSSPAPFARSEALFFLNVLRDRALPFGGFLVNRVITAPTTQLDPAALPATGPLTGDKAEDRWRALMAGVAKAPAQRAQLAEAHARNIAELRAAGPPTAPCWTIPDQPEDLHDLEALASLAPYLPDRSALRGR